MPWRDEAEEGLPSPRRNEPGHLRQDILDELTDHLAFAAEREQERGAKTDAEIRQRVLEHFGNPMTIARKLWFDAMKETIMRDWIQTIVIGVMCVSVVGFMAFFYQQMQTTNNAIISALNDRPMVAEDLYPSVEIHLYRGTIDGPAVEGVEVSIEGRMFTEEYQTFHEITDSEGLFSFGPVRPGSYIFKFHDTETDMKLNMEEVLFSGEGAKVLQIAVPSDADKKPLAVDVPLPEFIDDSYQRILLTMTETWTSGDYSWTHESEVMAGKEGLYLTRSSRVVSRGAVNGIELDGFGRFYSSASHGQDEYLVFVTAHEISFSNPRGLFNYDSQEENESQFRLLGKPPGGTIRYSQEITNAAGYKDVMALYATYSKWKLTKPFVTGEKFVIDLPKPFLNAYATFSLCHWNQQNTDQVLSDDILYMLSSQNPGFVLKDTYEIPWSSRIFNISNSDQWAFFPQENLYSIDEKGGAFFHLPDVFDEVSEPSIMKLLLALNFRQIRDENNTLNAYWAYDFDDKIEKRFSREPLKLSEQPFWELDMKDVREKLPGKHPTAMQLQTFHMDISSVLKSSDEEQAPSGFVIKWESAKNNEADVIHANYPANNLNGGYPLPIIAVMQPIEEAMAEREEELTNSGV